MMTRTIIIAVMSQNIFSSRVKAIAFTLFTVLIINLGFAVPSLAAVNSLAALPIVKNLVAGDYPTDLGVQDGSLAPCPDSPNCVVTQQANDPHTIEPITYQTDLANAKETLLKVLTVVPGTEVVEQSDNYIRAQSTSKIMGFIDDVEFYFPADRPEIAMRSASRLGESALGVNRRRLEQIRLAMKDLEV